MNRLRWTSLTLFICLTACSSLNPFKNRKSEDYNALTYGNEFEGAQNRDGSWSDRNAREVIISSENPYTRGDRNVAAVTVKETKDSYYGDEVLDPANESVRAEIEARRGYLNSNSFARGDRATRSDFYDSTPNDGSLWAKENDANYFFTKGKIHTRGDIVSVKLEESMIKQFAEEIKKGLTPAEQEVEMALYLKNEAGAKNDQDLKAYRNIAEDDLRSSEAEEVKTKMEKAVRWSQVDLTKAIALSPNEELRAEVIDRYQNGNLKIRAVKRVLYRGSSKMVSMVAVAPVADLDEKDTINSGKLYEHKIKVAR